MRLAAAILLLVAGTHYGYEPLASLSQDPDRVGRALFYVLRGLEGTSLFLIVGFLAGLLCSALKDWRAYPAIALSCLWGAAEEFQTSACRLAHGVSVPVPDTGWTGICGALTGIPMYGIGLAGGACLAAYLSLRMKNGR